MSGDIAVPGTTAAGSPQHRPRCAPLTPTARTTTPSSPRAAPRDCSPLRHVTPGGRFKSRPWTERNGRNVSGEPGADALGGWDLGAAVFGAGGRLGVFCVRGCGGLFGAAGAAAPHLGRSLIPAAPWRPRNHRLAVLSPPFQAPDAGSGSWGEEMGQGVSMAPPPRYLGAPPPSGEIGLGVTWGEG